MTHVELDSHAFLLVNDDEFNPYFDNMICDWGGVVSR